MALKYCTWADVTARYALASEHVSVGADQERRIAEKTAIFRAYTRNIRRARLTPDSLGEFDALARTIVACLVAGELQRKDTADDTQNREMDFGFFRGVFSDLEIEAWQHIAALKSNEATLEEDPALRDVTIPDPVASENNTGNGEVLAVLPFGYKGDTPGRYRVECTTNGRVDAGTARFSVFYQGNATAIMADVIPSLEWTHVQHELYIMFRDVLTLGESFAVGDSWDIRTYPPSTPAQGKGIRRMETFLG